MVSTFEETNRSHWWCSKKSYTTSNTTLNINIWRKKTETPYTILQKIPWRHETPYTILQKIQWRHATPYTILQKIPWRHETPYTILQKIPWKMYKILTGKYDDDVSKSITPSNDSYMRGHHLKLYKSRSRLDIRKYTLRKGQLRFGTVYQKK